MIFVTLGSQKFQFDRVLMYIDEILSKPEFNKLTVFAQTGYSTYQPENFTYKNFLSRSEFLEKMENAEVVITHGGTGAIVSALKQSKTVLAIPRNKDFKEHVDNHQIEIVDVFYSKEFIEKFYTKEELENLLKNYPNLNSKKKIVSNSESYITFISNYILSGGVNRG